MEDINSLKHNITGKKRSKKKYRKYHEEYLAFGFTSVCVEDEVRPQCIICNKILAAASLVPCKLKRHLISNHKELTDKPREFFEHINDEIIKGTFHIPYEEVKVLTEKQKKDINKSDKNLNLLLASYQFAYRIAQSKKPHTHAKNSTIIEELSSILGEEEEAKQLLSIPLSNSTICRRITDMSDDLNQQLIEKIKMSKFYAIQIDEAVDSCRNDAYLIVYVRFMDEGQVVDDLLFCKELERSTKVGGIFNIIDSFLTDNSLEWLHCVGVSINGACNESFHFERLKDLICDKAQDALCSHFLLPKDVLCPKSSSSVLENILETIIDVVNYIKERPKSKMFCKFCENLNDECIALIVYCKSRWLSRTVLNQVYELRKDIYQYLIEENSKNAYLFNDSKLIILLAYLCNIYEKLNTSLEGGSINILVQSDELNSFIKKLNIWQQNVNNDCFDMFPAVNEMIMKVNEHTTGNIKVIILRHLTSLELHLKKNFHILKIDSYDWIRNPYDNNFSKTTFSITEEKQLYDILQDGILKTEFPTMSLAEFWISIHLEYKEICEKALKILLPFTSSNFCEEGFAAVATIKNKFRNRINLEREMRLSVSKIQPRFEKLCSQKQAQPSH